MPSGEGPGEDNLSEPRGQARQRGGVRISGLALDAEGFLYVSDAQEDRVDVFGRDGRHVAAIGRRGQGPGEFRYPTSLAFTSAGELLVRDQSRLQRFARQSAHEPATRFATVISSLSMYDWMSQRTGVVEQSGATHVPRSYSTGRAEEQVHVQMMLRLGADGRVLDSLLVPEYRDQPAPYARVMLSASEGRMLRVS